MRRIALLAALALTACSPMPGKFGLLPGFDEPLAEDDPRIIEHPGTLWETVYACNAASWHHSFGGKISNIATLGMTYGCSWHTWAMIDGKPRLFWADVYYPEGWTRARQHELLHARGYADHPLFRF